MKSPLQLAALEKAQAYRTPDLDRRADSSRNFAEAKIADAIERALAVAPPLTTAQVKRLSGLLRGGR